MMYPSHFELVGEFHDVFGHPQRSDRFVSCFEDDPELVGFRISLLREELGEFKQAMDRSDVIEMADALCDIAYVGHGAGQCLGIRIPANVKISESGCTEKYFQDNKKMISDRYLDMNRYFERLVGAVESKNFNDFETSLLGLVDRAYGVGQLLMFDMDKMFREVHRSNMSKSCTTIRDAEDSVARYKSEGRYCASIKTKGKYYIVYDEPTGKILKNCNWSPPDLKQFIKS